MFRGDPAYRYRLEKVFWDDGAHTAPAEFGFYPLTILRVLNWHIWGIECPVSNLTQGTLTLFAEI